MIIEIRMCNWSCICLVQYGFWLLVLFAASHLLAFYSIFIRFQSLVELQSRKVYLFNNSGKCSIRPKIQLLSTNAVAFLSNLIKSHWITQGICCCKLNVACTIAMWTSDVYFLQFYVFHSLKLKLKTLPLINRINDSKFASVLFSIGKKKHVNWGNIAAKQIERKSQKILWTQNWIPIIYGINCAFPPNQAKFCRKGRR